MRKAGRGGTQGGEHLYLHGGVGDVIFSAEDIGDAHGNIVYAAGQHVQPRPIGAADHRIGELRSVEFLRPAHAIVPGDGFVVVSLKRQCGAMPSASFAARSSLVSRIAPRS